MKEVELTGEFVDFNCHKCGSKGYKTDGLSRVWCADCLSIKLDKYGEYDGEKVEQYVRGDRKVGRNEKCPCKSGIKYKKCCLIGSR